jgi:SH3-like domain-containing protein
VQEPLIGGGAEILYQMVGGRQSVRVGAIILALLGGSLGAPAAGGLATGPQSGLPLPRFVSLKADRVNVRAGPTRDHEVNWVYTRAGLPVEVTAEYENWRRIRDWQGSEGWVYHSLLSGRRTALAMPKHKDDLVPVYSAASATSPVTARLQAGVLASVDSCTGAWCYIVGKKFAGWIEQRRIWGAYPNEKVN